MLGTTWTAPGQGDTVELLCQVAQRDIPSDLAHAPHARTSLMLTGSLWAAYDWDRLLVALQELRR